jgi:hypothetical protein
MRWPALQTNLSLVYVEVSNSLFNIRRQLAACVGRRRKPEKASTSTNRGSVLSVQIYPDWLDDYRGRLRMSILLTQRRARY